eukprot:maker-scaffold270_size230592-snap-gene-0.10 protein:Tk10968 transcript:maker-scaffold270_size230592-snap-gene-0.10-mRNA-1 annotation:"hypothetical protein CAPTEDRAFT_218451"
MARVELGSGRPKVESSVAIPVSGLLIPMAMVVVPLVAIGLMEPLIPIALMEPLISIPFVEPNVTIPVVGSMVLVPRVVESLVPLIESLVPLIVSLVPLIESLVPLIVSLVPLIVSLVPLIVSLVHLVEPLVYLVEPLVHLVEPLTPKVESLTLVVESLVPLISVIEGDWNLVEHMTSFDGKPFPPHSPYLCPESKMVWTPNFEGNGMNTSQIEGDWNLVEHMTSFDGKPFPPHSPYLCPESKMVWTPNFEGNGMNTSQLSIEWPLTFNDVIEWVQHKDKPGVFFHEENIFSLWTMKVMEAVPDSHMLVFFCIDYTIWPAHRSGFTQWQKAVAGFAWLIIEQGLEGIAPSECMKGEMKVHMDRAEEKYLACRGKYDEALSAVGPPDQSAEVQYGLLESEWLELSGIGAQALAMSSAPNKPEAMDAEAMDAEAMDAEAMDAEAMDAEAMDAEAMDAEAMDAEAMDAEAMDAEAVGREAMWSGETGRSSPTSLPPSNGKMAIKILQSRLPARQCPRPGRSEP